MKIVCPSPLSRNSVELLAFLAVKIEEGSATRGSEPVTLARFFRNREDLKNRREDFTSEFLCGPLRSSAVSRPLSQPGTGNNLKDRKEPKQAGWNFGFRA